MGSIPWQGMVFLTLYFQLLGMSDFAASLQIGLLLGSTALGGLLGGWIGDKAAAKFPDTGRIAVCQFSVFVGIPFSVMITKVLFNNFLTAKSLKYLISILYLYYFHPTEDFSEQSFCQGVLITSI